MTRHIEQQRLDLQRNVHHWATIVYSIKFCCYKYSEVHMKNRIIRLKDYFQNKVIISTLSHPLPWMLWFQQQMGSHHKGPATRKVCSCNDVFMNQRNIMPADVFTILLKTQIAKFMGPTWGAPRSCRHQMGPMLAPWALLSGNWFLFGGLRKVKFRCCSSLPLCMKTKVIK